MSHSGAVLSAFQKCVRLTALFLPLVASLLFTPSLSFGWAENQDGYRPHRD